MGGVGLGLGGVRWGEVYMGWVGLGVGGEGGISWKQAILSVRGGRTQVEKYFWPGEITQHIYHWQI